jgi:hypothetical protein
MTTAPEQAVAIGEHGQPVSRAQVTGPRAAGATQITRYVRLVRFSFLILIGCFVTLEP